MEKLEETIKNLVKEFDHIKVNIPDTISKFESGNGEGIWAVVCSADDMSKVVLKEGNAKVFICNDSVYWPKFVYGSEVEVDCSRPGRPVALMSQFKGEKCEADAAREMVGRHISGATSH